MPVCKAMGKLCILSVSPHLCHSDWLPVANGVADCGLSMQKALCSDIVTRVPGVPELRWPGEESGSVEVVAGSQSLSAVSAMALCR